MFSFATTYVSLVCKSSQDYLLAGKDADGGKFKDAVNKHNAQILNLRRLLRLLMGGLTFDSLANEDRLTSMSFRGYAYQLAQTTQQSAQSTQPMQPQTNQSTTQPTQLSQALQPDASTQLQLMPSTRSVQSIESTQLSTEQATANTKSN